MEMGRWFPSDTVLGKGVEYDWVAYLGVVNNSSHYTDHARNKVKHDSTLTRLDPRFNQAKPNVTAMSLFFFFFPPARQTARQTLWQTPIHAEHVLSKVIEAYEETNKNHKVAFTLKPQYMVSSQY